MKTILVLMLLISTPVMAEWSIDVGTGTTTYKTAHDGLWYQEQYPHALDMDSVPLSIGLSYAKGDLRYRLDYLSLGWAYSSSQVVSDFNYYTGSHAPAHAVMKGRGHADGFVLSVSKDIGSGFYGEAGLWIFKPVWKVSAYTLDRSRSLEIEGIPEWRAGPAIGLGYRKNAIDLSLRYLDMQHHGDESTQPIWNGAYVFMVKVCL